jgi:hypothetical protein
MILILTGRQNDLLYVALHQEALSVKPVHIIQLYVLT